MFAFYFGIKHCRITSLFLAQKGYFIVFFPAMPCYLSELMEPSTLEDRGILECMILWIETDEATESIVFSDQELWI